MSIRISVGLALLMAATCGAGVATGDCCSTPAVAAVAAPPVVTYRMDYRTQYEPQVVNTYRLEYETQYEERQVTSYRPVWETKTEERRYRVARQVPETAEREERRTVWRPVWETQYRDASYDRVRYVEETAEREERSTVWQPVCETQERQECRTVLRPVTQTVMQTQYSTAYQPVTTCRTVYSDQGGFVDQVSVKQPAIFRERLTWMPAATTFDPATGVAVQQSAGLYWVPRYRAEVNRVYQPNIVPQQVTQTNYVPTTVAQQVPVQVTNYQPEQVCEKVPVQVTRMVPQEVVRKIPYTVSRPVTERVEQKVPVQVFRWVAEEHVDKIPVTTYKTVYEERVEPVEVRVCRMEAVVETVHVPHVVEKRVPVEYSYCVPRVVCSPAPVEACEAPVSGYSTSVPPISGATVSPFSGRPTLAPPAKKPDEADNQPTFENRPGPEDPAKAKGTPKGEPASKSPYPSKPTT